MRAVVQARLKAGGGDAAAQLPVVLEPSPYTARSRRSPSPASSRASSLSRRSARPLRRHSSVVGAGGAAAQGLARRSAASGLARFSTGPRGEQAVPLERRSVGWRQGAVGAAVPSRPQSAAGRGGDSGPSALSPR